MRTWKTFPLLAMALVTALFLAGCQENTPATQETAGVEGGEIGCSGTVQSLEDGRITLTLLQDVACGEHVFPEGSDLCFPIDAPIQEVLDLEEIQVGDKVGAIFLSDTVQAGSPPTVHVVSFGLESWTMTGELLEFGENFFLVKPLYPESVVQAAERVSISRTGTHYGTDIDDPAVGMFLSFQCVRELSPGDPAQVTAFRWQQVADPYPAVE